MPVFVLRGIGIHRTHQRAGEERRAMLGLLSLTPGLTGFPQRPSLMGLPGELADAVTAGTRGDSFTATTDCHWLPLLLLVLHEPASATSAIIFPPHHPVP